MPDAKPLTREELDTYEVALRFGDESTAEEGRSLVATVQAAEARIEALRAALEEVLWTVVKDPVGGSGEVVAEVARESLHADDKQASGDYSVTRTPESAGGE